MLKALSQTRGSSIAQGALPNSRAPPHRTAQEGHLAATCPNGTVKWKTYFPPEEFLTFDAASLRRPEPDYAALEKAAREYAAMMATRAPTTGLGGPNHPLG